jgi:hypothetical protein
VQFSNAERKLAIDALHEAEEHAGSYYCIPPHRWQDMPYDMLTRRDRDWNPLPETVFAETRRVGQFSPGADRTCDFYRIQLNDPTILRAIRRGSLDAEFYPLLVYILTHEMVHLVRLSSILDPELETVLPRESEEARVDRISRQILSLGSSGRFRGVLGRVTGPPGTGF